MKNCKMIGFIYCLVSCINVSHVMGSNSGGIPLSEIDRTTGSPEGTIQSLILQLPLPDFSFNPPSREEEIEVARGRLLAQYRLMTSEAAAEVECLNALRTLNIVFSRNAHGFERQPVEVMKTCLDAIADPVLRQRRTMDCLIMAAGIHLKTAEPAARDFAHRVRNELSAPERMKDVAWNFAVEAQLLYEKGILEEVMQGLFS